jgi:hypothetical protein
MKPCRYFLRDDVDLSGEFEGSNPSLSAFDDFLEKLSKQLVESQTRLKWAQHYLKDALLRNHELSTRITCLELENKLLNRMIEKQIGRVQR